MSNSSPVACAVLFACAACAPSVARDGETVSYGGVNAGWLRADVAIEHGHGGGDAYGGAAPPLFDTRRNWHFVRTLLADEDAGVQRIFCSRGVKARLLRYAADHEDDARVIARAVDVLHQPTNARAHRDHFHVRVMCSAEERSLGCRDEAPIWPWLRDRVEKAPALDATALGDATLVDLLLAPDPAPGGSG